MPVTLLDVAGVRPLDDAGEVERMGIERAMAEKSRADVVVALAPAEPADFHEPAGVERAIASARALGGDVTVLSKIDLVELNAAARARLRAHDVVALSAKSGAGLDDLRRAIGDLLSASVGAEPDALLMRQRQIEHVEESHEALGVAMAALEDGEAGEVVASELRRAARAFDRLLGKDVDSDVLDLVFSKFCIGK